MGQRIIPTDVLDNKCRTSLLDSFDTFYYGLAAFDDVYKLSLIPNPDQSILSSLFQLLKINDPTFTSVITERQGFEDIFKSIFLHAPDLPEVE